VFVENIRTVRIAPPVQRQAFFPLATIIFPVASRRLLPAGTKVSGLKLS
jgi:hypothetical protein